MIVHQAMLGAKSLAQYSRERETVPRFGLGVYQEGVAIRGHSRRSETWLDLDVAVINKKGGMN